MFRRARPQARRASSSRRWRACWPCCASCDWETACSRASTASALPPAAGLAPIVAYGDVRCGAAERGAGFGLCAARAGNEHRCRRRRVAARRLRVGRRCAGRLPLLRDERRPAAAVRQRRHAGRRGRRLESGRARHRQPQHAVSCREVLRQARRATQRLRGAGMSLRSARQRRLASPRTSTAASRWKRATTATSAALGCMHGRRLQLSADGMRLEGRDRLAQRQAQRPPQIGCAVRHPFPPAPRCLLPACERQLERCRAVAARRRALAVLALKAPRLPSRKAPISPAAPARAAAMQIVLRGATFGKSEIKWAVERMREEPAA